MHSAHTRASLGGAGLAPTFLLWAGTGLRAHTLPATPVLGAGASEPRRPPAARAGLCRPRLSLLPPLTQQQPRGMDGGPHGGLLWLSPLLNPLSPQVDAQLGQPENSPREGRGAREPPATPSAVSAGDRPCPSSFGLSSPVHRGAPGSPSQAGSAQGQPIGTPPQDSELSLAPQEPKTVPAALSSRNLVPRARVSQVLLVQLCLWFLSHLVTFQ